MTSEINTRVKYSPACPPLLPMVGSSITGVLAAINQTGRPFHYTQRITTEVKS